MSTIRPWGNYICVADPPAEKNDGTYSGIVLPAGVGVDMLDKGVVIAAGPCVEANEHTPEGFAPGSVVWYTHGDAFEVAEPGGESIKFVPAGRIICWEPASERVEVG